MAAPQHFNPEEDNYEAEAEAGPDFFEPEVQQMAPAGDEEEDELNTAFFQEAEEAQEQAQGGAAGGWLCDECIAEEAEAEAAPEAGPRRKARRTLVPDWSQIPANAEVRWDFQIGDRHLTSYGYHAGEGKIRFGETISSSLADFIKKELVIWKSLGRAPQDMKPPHNAWKALEFERNDAWVRFDTIRAAAV
jgi:hypothetical protein